MRKLLSELYSALDRSSLIALKSRNPYNRISCLVHRISVHVLCSCDFERAKNQIQRSRPRSLKSELRASHCVAAIGSTSQDNLTNEFERSAESEMLELEKRPEPVQEVGRVLAFC